MKLLKWLAWPAIALVIVVAAMGIRDAAWPMSSEDVIARFEAGEFQQGSQMWPFKSRPSGSLILNFDGSRNHYEMYEFRSADDLLVIYCKDGVIHSAFSSLSRDGTRRSGWRYLDVEEMNEFFGVSRM